MQEGDTYKLLPGPRSGSLQATLPLHESTTTTTTTTTISAAIRIERGNIFSRENFQLGCKKQGKLGNHDH